MGLLETLGTFAGGIIDRNEASSNFDKNMAMQREFAKHGISWKVEDARNAGINPLYALGANTNSPSAVYSEGSKMSESLGSLGKAFQGVVDYKLERRLKEAEVKYAENRADLLETEVNQNRNPTSGSEDISGQSDMGKAQVVSPTVNREVTRGVEAGHNPYYMKVDHPSGSVQLVPNQKMSELVSEHIPSAIKDFIYEFGNFVKTNSYYLQKHNSASKAFMHRAIKFRDSFLPKPRSGYEYQLDPKTATFFEVKKNKDGQFWLNDWSYSNSGRRHQPKKWKSKKPAVWARPKKGEPFFKGRAWERITKDWR